MQIWVDADACPRAIKAILFRAAQRVGVRLTLVSNSAQSVPRSPHLRTIRVRPGFDEADREIVRSMQPGDLVVTGDIPLAAQVVEQGGLALDPRGELFTKENVQERLAVRNLLDDLRSAGLETSGPAAWSKRDQRNFANQLDRLLQRHAADEPTE